MEFSDVVRRRRMSRAFLDIPVDPDVLGRCIELASRSPSAGKTQGWHLVMLEGSDTARYWDIALGQPKRDRFAFPGLLRAPILLLVCADSEAYLKRYSEADKASTGLGNEQGAWPAPFWTIDASFATMTLLLALENEGLGALFFAHTAEEQLRSTFNIPAPVQLLGVIAAGHIDTESVRPGRSSTRPRKSAGQIVHRNTW